MIPKLAHTVIDKEGIHTKSKPLIQLLESGWVERSDGLQGQFDAHPELKQIVGRFNPGNGKGRQGSTTIDIFGRHWTIYYYLVDHPYKFIKHLETMFLQANPNPTPYKRHGFTKLLHDHNLEWSGSCVSRSKWDGPELQETKPIKAK
jgi:hypothetical protein